MCLYHLEHSQVFLPPEVLLHVRSNGSQHVVRVHDDVYESVEQPEECAVTAYIRKELKILLFKLNFYAGPSG